MQRILEEISTLLDLKGESHFKVQAYVSAARVVSSIGSNLKDLVETGRLRDIDGIGESIANKIIEYMNTGRCEFHDQLVKETPPGLLEMLKIPGIGPKKVKRLRDELGLSTIEALGHACQADKLIKLKGFGKKTQEKILKGIEFIKEHKGQTLYSEAELMAEHVIVSLRTCPEVIRISTAGSLRRKKEVVKDIDILVSTLNPEAVIDYFCTQPFVDDVVVRGSTKASVTLRSGINCDLRVVEDVEFPFALHYFTGSKSHNIMLRKRAKAMGLKLNEYGLYHAINRIHCRMEVEIFKKLGMSYIPPELREGVQEITLAEKGEIPTLVDIHNIRGMLHTHSNYSDGLNTIRELADMAKQLGFSYIGISDHSKSAFYANGLRSPDITRQHEEIDELNNQYEDFKIFKGIECDILVNGTLDYTANILKSFDYVIGAIHSSFGMSEGDMTQRIVDALDSRYIDILAHPTGRLLLVREAYKVDMQRVIEACRRNNVVIELNSQPTRLDVDWRELPNLQSEGVKISIEPDAHSIRELIFLNYGVGIARKGWVTQGGVLNTMTQQDIIKFFANRRRRNKVCKKQG